MKYYKLAGLLIQFAGLLYQPEKPSARTMALPEPGHIRQNGAKCFEGIVFKPELDIEVQKLYPV
jgi:hypothetical protein